MELALGKYLIVGALVFTAGLFCVLTRRNAIGVLLGVELILNSANINFVAFAHYNGGEIQGHLFALFCIVLAAAECAVALAIVLAIYRNFNKIIDMEEVKTLRN